MFQFWPVGAVVFIVCDPADASVVVVRHAVIVIWVETSHPATSVWLVPSVGLPVSAQSESMAKTYEPTMQLVTVTDARPVVEDAAATLVSAEVSAPVTTMSFIIFSWPKPVVALALVAV